MNSLKSFFSTSDNIETDHVKIFILFDLFGLFLYAFDGSEGL